MPQAGESKAADDHTELILNVVLLVVVVAAVLWKVGLSGLGLGKKSSARQQGSGHDDNAAADAAEELDEESEHEAGEQLELPVDDLHFGLPRCRVRAPGLDPLSEMIKWQPDSFSEHPVDVARIRVGTFGCWVVQGMKSNRILYAMKKRGDVVTAQCCVVEPPPPRDTQDDSEYPDTYGPDLRKIQLIP